MRRHSALAMSRRVLSTLVLVGAAVAVTVAQAPRPQRDIASFLDAILTAGERGDRRAVAAMVQYPLVVQASGFRIRIDSTGDVLRHFDTIFSSQVWQAFEQARQTLSRTTPDPTLVTAYDGGASIANGLARVRRVDGRLKLSHVVLPTLERGWKAARGTAETIAFRAGEPPAVRRGLLARGERETFLLYVSAGQRLSVRVDEVAGRDVVVTVFQHTNNTPLDARAGSGVRAWTGRVRFDGTARLTVVRQRPGGGPLPYSLSVDLR